MEKTSLAAKNPYEMTQIASKSVDLDLIDEQDESLDDNSFNLKDLKKGSQNKLELDNILAI
jgi:hypothetical protein